MVDHLGNVYSASSTVTLDEQQHNNDTTKINGTVCRPDSVTLSKDEPGDPSLLENTWKDSTNQKGDFNQNGESKEFIIYSKFEQSSLYANFGQI